MTRGGGRWPHPPPTSFVDYLEHELERIQLREVANIFAFGVNCLFASITSGYMFFYDFLKRPLTSKIVIVFCLIQAAALINNKS